MSPANAGKPQSAPPSGAAANDARDAGDGDSRRAARRRPAGPARVTVAANDDVPSIGGLIFALHQKPSQRPLQVAAIASVVWTLLGILLGWAMLAPELQRAPSFLEMLSRPTAITLAATIIIPIALFWFLALLVSRAQELRLMSSAMTEVAIRLAEPDRMAEQQIASVGQAVRRQVGHMNEAVSRALGRAGELEALVHNEVASLEQSYTQNESRIRGLLQELSGERHALLNTSERVNMSLRELSSEVPRLIDRLGEQQVKLARFIEDAGRNLVALETSLAQNTNTLATTLDTGGNRLQVTMDESATRLQSLLTDGTQRLQSQLQTSTGDVEVMLEKFSSGIDSTLANRTDGLQVVLDEYTRALDATLSNRQQSLDTHLVERTKALDDAFTERLRGFDESILRSTISIDSAVADKARALSLALENHAKDIGQVLGKQAGVIDEQLMNGVSAVRRVSETVTRQSIKAIEDLAGQADLLKNVSENLLGQISGVTNRFDQQGAQIMRAANALETANSRIDKTLQSRQIELSETLDRLAGKAGDIDHLMRGYSTSIEGTLTEAEKRARYVGETLTKGAEERSRVALSELERLQSSAGFDTDRALADLRSKFSNVSREVSDEIGSLSARFADTSEEMRQRARKTLGEIEIEQSRLKEQLERLPEATRQSAETMRASLQEQLRALDKLSTLSRGEGARAEISQPLAPPPANPRVQSPSRSISSVSQSLASEIGARSRIEPPSVPLRPAPPPPPQQQAPTPLQPVAQPPQGQPAALQPAPGSGDANRDNWSLGDLLARASKDEEHQGAQINLAHIARALDVTTASAIWSRLRAGQRGIMVRSIYAPEGRTMFDEVRQRFRTEPVFRQAVERYIIDFEQILRDADASDTSGRTTQAYIVSDSGRVYLFLAHASGRLA